MKNMSGAVYSLNISAEKGTAKKPVPEAVLREDYGVEGDAHAGLDEKKQVSLLPWESIRRKNFCLRKAKKEELAPGIFAENITTCGIELSGLKIGDRFRAGEAVLEVSQLGKKCHAHCEIYKKTGECIMPGEGVFARVVKGGKIKAGDVIEKII
jgi:MOSC domain-containing protein YiiM